MESLWKGNAIPNNKLAPVTKHLDQYATVLQVVQGMLFLMVEGIRPTFKYNVIQIVNVNKLLWIYYSSLI